MYTIRQKLYKAQVGCFCVVAVLRKGGYDVPVRNLVTATVKLIALCNAIDENTKGTVRYHDHANQWAIYGSILKKGEESSITKMSMGAGLRVLAAVGDENASDIDLFFLDEDGDVIARDEKPDATPIVSLRTRATQSYGLRVKNMEARGATLVLTAVLQIVDQ